MTVVYLHTPNQASSPPLSRPRPALYPSSPTRPEPAKQALLPCDTLLPGGYIEDSDESRTQLGAHFQHPLELANLLWRIPYPK